MIRIQLSLLHSQKKENKIGAEEQERRSFSKKSCPKDERRDEMKSFRQSILIAAAVVMIAACVILILLSRGVKEKKPGSGEERYTGTIENLVVEAGACEIEIVEGGTDAVTLSWQGIPSEDISGTLENGTLKIKSSYSKNWNLGFLIKFTTKKREDAKIVLTIPKDKVFQSVVLEFGAAEVEAERILAEELKISVGAGEMEADYLWAGKSAKISVGAGSLSADAVSLTNADLNCGVGEMDLAGEIFGDSTVDCGVGEVELTLTTEEASYRGRLDCGLGSLKFGTISVNGSGKKDYGASSAENRMDIKCGVGEVDVHFR